MKKYTLLSVLFLTLLGTFLFCGDDETGTAPDPGPDPTILTGTWEDTISKAGLGVQNTVVGITLSSSKRSYANTFQIYSKDSSKAFYNYMHRGTWQITGDTITLTGNSIEMWDANGTAIGNVPDSVANKVYKLDTTRTYGATATTWGSPGNVIEIQDISCSGGVALCLGIPFNTVFTAEFLMTQLNFEKK